MDETEFVKAQKQTENINQDITEFFGDFDKWKSEVERKMAVLQAKSSLDENLPPVRNVLHRKKRKKRSDEKINTALKEVDRSESENSESDEEMDKERRLRLSGVEKEEGNKLFKEGKYEEAVEKYTKAIGFAPGNPLLYTNRAIALYKLERYASAESDCSAALNMNPKLVKGLFRRAQARKALGKIEEAISDLKRILDIEPRNSAVLKDLSAWTEEVNLRAGSTNSLYKIIDVSKTTNSSHLCRIKILDVSEEVPTKSIPSGDSSAPKTPTPTMPTKPPTNWLQLERDLRELIPSGDSLTPQAVDYLCSLEPQNYESVIGGSLTSSCLGHLIKAMSTSPSLSSTQKAERLKALGNLPRFNVAWMLAEDSDRQAVDKLLEELPGELSESLKLLFA